jgi:Ca2+-binding RTX toxin-like protein
MDNDILYADNGVNLLYGDSGVDTVDFSTVATGVTADLTKTTAITYTEGSVKLQAIENINGSNYADTLTGTQYANTLNGGAGIDLVDYGDATAAVMVNLSLTTAQVINQDQGSDTLTNIEHIKGSKFNDTLTGNASNNIFYGDAGNDTLDGGEGIDTLDLSKNIYQENGNGGVQINLASITAQSNGSSGGDILLNFENINGTNYNDTLDLFRN